MTGLDWWRGGEGKGGEGEGGDGECFIGFTCPKGDRFLKFLDSVLVY